MQDMDRYRDLFPITKKYVFLNSAAVSPPSLPVVDAVGNLFQEFSTEGISCYGSWMKRVADTRSLFARLIGARSEEIAFTGNTSDGLSAVAMGMQWKKGDVVLLPRPDFPSNVYPWLNLERLGIKVHFFDRTDGRFETRDVEAALVPGTRLISVSSVDYASGFRCNLEELGELCRNKGILLCVDAIQSLGVIPMNVKKCGIHFLASGGHKWLLSTMGIGALFVDSEVNDMLHPVRVGWRSVVNENDFSSLHFQLKPDALRFESGTLNLPGITALGAALSLILGVGVPRIRDHVSSLVDEIHAGLARRNLRVVSGVPVADRSGIVSFVPASDPGTLFQYLLSRRVMVSLRGEWIRLSPHFFNNSEDVRAFFQVLDRHGL